MINDMDNRTSEDKILIKNALIIGAAMLVFIVFQRGSAIIAYQLLKLDRFFSPESGAEAVISTVCSYLFGGGACAVILTFADRARQKKMSIGAPVILEALLISATVVVIGNLLGNAVTFVLGGDNGFLEEVLDDNILVTVVSVVVISPVCEELIFRRMLIPRLTPYGERTAVFFSAFAFAMLHGNFLQFFYTLGLGILFGYIFVKTGRVVYTVLIHALINLTGGVIAPFVTSKGETAIYVYTAITVLIAAIGAFFLCRRLQSVRLSSPEKDTPASKKRVFVYLNPFSAAYFILCAAVFVLTLLQNGR